MVRERGEFSQGIPHASNLQPSGWTGPLDALRGCGIAQLLAGAPRKLVYFHHPGMATGLRFPMANGGFAVMKIRQFIPLAMLVIAAFCGFANKVGAPLAPIVIIGAFGAFLVTLQLENRKWSDFLGELLDGFREGMKH